MVARTATRSAAMKGVAPFAEPAPFTTIHRFSNVLSSGGLKR